MTDTNDSFWHKLLRPIRVIFPWPPVRPPQQPSTDMRAATSKAQLELLVSAFGGGVEGGGRDGGGLLHVDEDGNSYLAHPSRVLLPRDAAERLDGFFGDQQDSYDGRGGIAEDVRVAGDVVAYNLPSRRRRGQVELESTLRDLDAMFGDRVARPDHILYVTPGGIGHLCPADEPETPTTQTPVPASRPGPQESNVRISVVDTGWIDTAAKNAQTPWLATGYIGGDAEPMKASALHPYAGHGTFVSGVIRCMAPGVRIEHEGVLDQAGAAYESEISAELDEAMGDEPQLISISAGGYSRMDLGLIAFEALSAAHGLEDGANATLVVAAAGNDFGDRPFWPAAYGWVLSVGALESSPTDKPKVCDFSNTGRWVDVYAHGRNLVNAFPAGTYVCTEPKNKGEVRTFTGLAQWSGTSFSTPIVTGLIAAYLTANPGATVHDAKAAVLKTAKPFNDPRVKNGLAVGPPFVP